jgi:hypothetical protein
MFSLISSVLVLCMGQMGGFIIFRLVPANAYRTCLPTEYHDIIVVAIEQVYCCSVMVTMLVTCTSEGLGKRYLMLYHNLEYTQIAVIVFASVLGVYQGLFMGVGSLYSHLRYPGYVWPRPVLLYSPCWFWFVRSCLWLLLFHFMVVVGFYFMFICTRFM